MKIQDSSFNGLKVTVGTKSVTHARTHALTDAPKAICPITFFKVGGIIKTPVLKLFLTCIGRDSLCYNIFISSQELSCRHKPISNSKLTDPSASSGSPHSREMTDTHQA